MIAQIEGFAVGGGLGIAAGADLRIATPESRFGAPIARTLGNCLSMQAYARYLDLFGPSRLKELIFTARLLTADEALAAGFVHEIVAAEAIEARVRALAETIASHAPITLWVTKEAVRRIQEARTVPDGDDLDRQDLRQRRFPRRRARLHRKAPAALDGTLDASVQPARQRGQRRGASAACNCISRGRMCASARRQAPRKAERRRPAGPRPVREDACPW